MYKYIHIYIHLYTYAYVHIYSYESCYSYFKKNHTLYYILLTCIVTNTLYYLVSTGMHFNAYIAVQHIHCSATHTLRCNAYIALLY